jgi:hypothetical protein
MPTLLRLAFVTPLAVYPPAMPGFPHWACDMATSQGPVLVPKEKRSALEETLFLARDPHPDRGSSDDRVAIVAKENRHASWDASKLEVPVSELRRLAKVNQMVGTKPSIARRLLRTLIGFFIAASIGVGATLAWQRHGDETDKVIRNWAVASLDWVSSFSTAKWPPHVDAAAKQSMSDSAQVSAHETALPQTGPVPQTTPSPKSVPISSEVLQQLETAARNLAALQQSIAELATKQEEMSSNIAKLQAADREIRQKLATARKKVPIAPQQPPSPAPTSSTQTTPPQPSSTQLSSTSEIRPAPIPRPPSVLRP